MKVGIVHMRAQRVAVSALALAVAVSGLGSLTARADVPTPTASVSGARDEPAPLTAAQVKAQVVKAEALRRDLQKANAAVGSASAALAELSAKSGAAMDAVATAKAAEVAARKTEVAASARLKALSAQAARARTDVDRMAYDAYVNGSSSLQDIAVFVDLVAREGDDAQNASLVGYLADARAADGHRFTSLAQAQRVSARAAVAARLTREAATAKAQAAQAQVARNLAAQQRALVALRGVAKDKDVQLRKLGVDPAGLGAGVDLAVLSKIATVPLCSNDTGDYPNGALPGSALCPLTGASEHMLRPAAARAFDAMRLAYERDMGAPLCITDSYRSFAAQVDVKARKPTLAATPGTSNHGLGLAVDLCGGIESFATPAHRWMKQHAPLFGWFHPSWAEPGGSKPEPWHWEFAG